MTKAFVAALAVLIAAVAAVPAEAKKKPKPTRQSQAATQASDPYAVFDNGDYYLGRDPDPHIRQGLRQQGRIRDQNF